MDERSSQQFENVSYIDGTETGWSTMSQQPRHNPAEKYKCPKCHSPNVQAFEMVYHGGTSEDRFSGSGYGYHAGYVNVSGTTRSQSYLAGQTAPPKRPNPFLLAIIGSGVMVFFSVMPALYAYILAPALLALGIMAELVIIVAAFVLCGMFIAPPANAKYKKEYDQWLYSWICMRCGNAFYLD